MGESLRSDTGQNLTRIRQQHSHSAMTASEMEPLKNIIHETIENLELAQREFTGKTGQRADAEFYLEKFWTDINTVAKKLSFECTKVCICFAKSPIPTPSETSSLLSGIEQAVICLVSVFHKLPLTMGTTLHSHIQSEAVKAVQATKNLLVVIKNEGSKPLYKYSTGVAWEGCCHLENMQLDNKSAVLIGMKAQNNMVDDAFREISEALEGDGCGWNCPTDGSEDLDMEDESHWTNEDKALIGPSVNLIKAAKILYKRLMTAVEKNGLCTSIDMIKELDQVFEDCARITGQVDVLVQELYPPLSVSDMEEQSHQLANILHTVLKTCVQSHVVGEPEQPHMEFIQKAIDHNLDCMKDKLSKR